MQQLSELVERAGGVVHKRELVAAGVTDRMLTAAVRFGHLRRPRRGWYTIFRDGDPRHEAVRVGGRLTGASLLALHGAWLWRVPSVTVVVAAHASRLRPRRGTRVIWRDHVRPGAPRDVTEAPTGGAASEPSSEGAASKPTADATAADSVWAVPLEVAMIDAVIALPLVEAVAVLDWSLDAGLFTLDELREVFTAAPLDAAGIVEWVDPGSDSIIESIMRVTFVRLGHRVETQVVAAKGDRRLIDIVVDDAAAVELDGRAHHADTFDRDRIKDLVVTIAGRTALRASFAMVRDHRQLIVEAVHEVLSRRPNAPFGTRTKEARPPRSLVPRGRRRWRISRRHNDDRAVSPTVRGSVRDAPRPPATALIGES